MMKICKSRQILTTKDEDRDWKRSTKIDKDRAAKTKQAKIL